MRKVGRLWFRFCADFRDGQFVVDIDGFRTITKFGYTVSFKENPAELQKQKIKKQHALICGPFSLRFGFEEKKQK